jgi:LytS/YehU family sensor histidine kinase
MNSKIQESNKTSTESSGIGLKNVRRRLELSYPDQYVLHIDDGNDQFSVDLKLLQI